MPIVRANLCVPPNPGVIPRLTSGCPKIAFSEQILISQLNAISSPPPKAYPFIAAIIGIGNVSNFLKYHFLFWKNLWLILF